MLCDDCFANGICFNFRCFMSSIFEFENHFSYLKFRLGSAKERGIKGHFSAHIQIQPAYLSQVLAGKFSLSLEQADLASSFLELTVEESDFFLLLVSRDRAGTVKLKERFSKQIDFFLERRTSIVARFGAKAEVPEDLRGIYYSSWLYMAVHVALNVPKLRKPSNLSDYLGVSKEKILLILMFLEKHGFAVRKGDEFYTEQKSIRLGRESSQISQLHANWRNQAIQSLDSCRDEDIHYSGVFAIDAKTSSIIREALLENLHKHLKMVETAPDEEVYAYSFDFYKLNKMV